MDNNGQHPESWTTTDNIYDSWTKADKIPCHGQHGTVSRHVNKTMDNVLSHGQQRATSLDMDIKRQHPELSTTMDNIPSHGQQGTTYRVTDNNPSHEQQRVMSNSGQHPESWTTTDNNPSIRQQRKSSQATDCSGQYLELWTTMDNIQVMDNN